MTDTTNWVIVAAKGGFDIVSNKRVIGTIRATSSKWHTGSYDIVVGYVRGVERCSVLRHSGHPREIGKVDPR